jgi:CrcB protein
VNKLLIVGAGGFLGSIGRYLTGRVMQRLCPEQLIPLGTLTANVVGCLLIGMVVSILDARQLDTQPWRLFLVVGLLGGFTTFSAFGYETVTLARDTEWGLALLNAGAHLIAGLLAVAAGLAAGRAIG